jgi:hypothetical protein
MPGLKIKEMRDRLRAITPEVMKRKVLEVIRNHEETAVNMNTDQLFAGQLANGQDMPDYSMVSVIQFGKRPGPYQLYETGEFYRDFFIKAYKFPIVFDSRNEKTNSIMALIDGKGQDPDEIFGLNKTNRTELARIYALPDLQSYLRTAIRVR